MGPGGDKITPVIEVKPVPKEPVTLAPPTGTQQCDCESNTPDTHPGIADIPDADAEQVIDFENALHNIVYVK